MALEQPFQEALTRNDSNGGDISSLKDKTSATTAITSANESRCTGFECNICLDPVQDPVVTLCGHLYCWPCIYRWLHLESVASTNHDEHAQKCPVCKAEVSENMLIPLYGRSQTKSSKGKASHLDIIIPKRPLGPAHKSDMPRSPNTIFGPDSTEHLYYQNYPHNSELYYSQLGSYTASHALRSDGSGTLRSVCSPLIGMFGEMVYARIFGNSNTNLYAYPNSYDLGNISSPRVRRRIMETDKSLGRVSFFLFCCLLLCLLSF